MSNETTKHASTNGQGGYEHQDLQASSIFYFLLTIVLVTVLCLFVLRGFYAYLDHHEKAAQPAVNPLVTNVPTDTRHIAPGYPQSVFPDPKLEEDERGQLNGVLFNEEKTLYSYGWVDEKAGTVRIPIERAMDLIVQRGLPVRPQGVANHTASHSGASRKEPNKTTPINQGEKK
jgi:hypothetical protein